MRPGRATFEHCKIVEKREKKQHHKKTNIMLLLFTTLIVIIFLPTSTSFAVDPQSPVSFVVEFTTDLQHLNPSSLTGTSPGIIVINVTRHSAPRGADRFWALLHDHYFDHAAFFRIVPNFVVQFGIAAEPFKTKQWDIKIPDDPVIDSNVAGSLVYAKAGPNTRTTELFINFKNNFNLDTQGFAPFGRVLQGMDVLQKIYNPTPHNTGGIEQRSYEELGNVWLKVMF